MKNVKAIIDLFGGLTERFFGPRGPLPTLPDLARCAILHPHPARVGVSRRRDGGLCTEERVMRRIAVAGLVVVLTGPAVAQDTPKPGPEHELLKKREGIWSTTMKAGGMEFKGAVTYKMELGGLWLVGSMDSDLGGHGREAGEVEVGLRDARQRHGSPEHVRG